MEKAKDPLIAIEQIKLMEAHVALGGAEGSSQYNLALTAYKRLLSDDANRLTIVADFDVMYGIDNPKFRLEAKFLAQYNRKNDVDEGLPWESFSDGMALAHVIPYLREFISNITGRMPLPPLYIRALNTYRLVEEFHKREKACSEEKVTNEKQQLLPNGD
jgi:hypothetical protein